MEKQTTEPTVASSPTWERLEAWLRSKMREWLQDLLDAEVDELLCAASRRVGRPWMAPRATAADTGSRGG
jgi:hypothetical protein